MNTALLAWTIGLALSPATVTEPAPRLAPPVVRMTPRAPDPPADRWFAEDKLKHLTMAFATTQVGYGVARTATDASIALTLAIAATTAASIGKELHDVRAGAWFSARDLVWDAAGLALGVLLARRID